MGEEPYSVTIRMDELLTHPYLEHWTHRNQYNEFATGLIELQEKGQLTAVLKLLAVKRQGIVDEIEVLHGMLNEFGAKEDYGATLAWMLVHSTLDTDVMTVTTMARLAV